jgi:hypothetical protein
MRRGVRSTSPATRSEGTVTSVSSVREAVTEEAADAARDVPLARAHLVISGESPALAITRGVVDAGTAADQITTYRFSSQYGDLLHEENPFRRPDGHPVLPSPEPPSMPRRILVSLH